jgi:hypothetical protein
MFEELIVRWFQFSAMCPLMRLHGHRAGGPPANECGATNGDNELWTLADEGSPRYNAMLRMVLLRDQIADYVVAINREWVETGFPMMRPMFLQFPHDPLCQGADVEDQFFFGDKWLVAPITSYQTYSRSVYFPLLPANMTYVYFFNATEIGRGGYRTTLDAPLPEFPLFEVRPATPPPPPPCTPRTWAPAQDGYLSAGDDVIPASNHTLADAQAVCAATKGCVGITFEAASASPPGVIANVYFKSSYNEQDAAGWFSFAYCVGERGERE